MAQSNGFVASSGAYDGDDDKPMLLMKKSIDSQGNGLTALINKQLQGEIAARKCRFYPLKLLECGMTKTRKPFEEFFPS